MPEKDKELDILISKLEEAISLLKKFVDVNTASICLNKEEREVKKFIEEVEFQTFKDVPYEERSF